MTQEKHGGNTVNGRVAPQLLIVIICYHVVELTISCLRSIAPQIGNVPSRVVVCDNGTGEEAVKALRQGIVDNGWTDWVSLQAIHPNVGFTGGNNAVLREAMKWPSPPKYVMLLNADTEVQQGALKRLFDALERSPEIGIMGTALMNPNGSGQNSCFRDHSPMSEFLRGAGFGLLNRALRRKNFPLAPADGQSNYDWVSFASAVIRTDVIRDIGFLDEGFFLYFDDADYCRTARKAGWKIGCCQESRVVHLEGQSNEVPENTRALRRRPRYYYVSRARYFAKHIGTLGFWAANVAWSMGSVFGYVKQAVNRRKTSACQGEWKDIWTNACSPIRSSDASLVPKESRFVL